MGVAREVHIHELLRKLGFNVGTINAPGKLEFEAAIVAALEELLEQRKRR